MTPKELRNLKRLIKSGDEANIELALSLIGKCKLLRKWYFAWVVDLGMAREMCFRIKIKYAGMSWSFYRKWEVWHCLYERIDSILEILHSKIKHHDTTRN